MADADEPLLTPETGTVYLVERGVLRRGPGLTARELGGGVSNVVIAASDRQRRVVLKQALPRLRVADEWLADPGRAQTEALALQLAHELTPGLVPPVVDRDPARGTLTIEQAPDDWSDWKSQLMAGQIDPSVAAEIGAALAAWQNATTDVAALPEQMRGTEAFEQLRVDPYHRTVAENNPEAAEPILAAVEELLAHRRCLVHGDFSPKNVLVGPEGVWVIDFEVAHYGDPAFDLAFLLTHLLLKSIHNPQWTDGYGACAEAFLTAWDNAATVRPGPGEVSRQLGCLLLARVDGKSPAEYLTFEDRPAAWRLGLQLLCDPVEDVNDIWEGRDGSR